MAAPGVLAGVTGNGPPFTAHLVTQAAHGTVTVNGDGDWSYTPNTGYNGPDSFQFDATDSQDDTSNAATVSLNVVFGALSDVDQTKLPSDTLQLPMQILGSSSGQPATADNLSLVYHSSTAQRTQTLEQDFQPSMGSELVSIAEPTVDAGSPVWSLGYNFLWRVSDKLSFVEIAARLVYSNDAVERAFKHALAALRKNLARIRFA